MNGIYNLLGPDGYGVYEISNTEVRRIDGSAETVLVPGFVDIHIHGSFGIDFMSASGPEEIVAWAERLAEVGYEYFLPTTVTGPIEDIKRAISHIPDHPMIPGFHLEGPFISHQYPGAQPKQWIAAVPEPGSEWDEVLDHPLLRVITIAPEIPGALDLIRRLTARGVVVSMGHTNATYREAAIGHEAGGIHTTHTYNAMRPLHHREAGTVGFSLSCDTLTCELVYDRHHVSPEAAGILVRAKPADRLIAVSDATMAAGLPNGSTVHMWGLTGLVGDGMVRLEDGTLAGSAITLLDAFRNLWADFGPEVAIRACCINPRADLGLTKPKVYVELNRNLEIIRRHTV